MWKRKTTNPAVTSFNTDGYSESYGNTLNADEARRQMNKLVGEYLYGERDRRRRTTFCIAG